MSSVELYFTRHGQTEWNQEMRFQGREGDSPLLPKSHQEIERLGRRLRDVPFAQIYSSPQKRARDTAIGIQKQLSTPVAITYHEGLREIGMGELEGAYINEAKVRYAEELADLRFSPEQYDGSAFGGEAYQEMLARGTTVILEAVAEHEKGPLLFVSHGATLTGCIQYLAGAEIENVRQMGGLGNNTLSLLKTKDQLNRPFELLLWNDDQHLV